MKHDIITALDINVDVLVSLDNKTIEFTQKEKLIHDYAVEMGGSSCIFACQAAKLGLSTAGIGTIGNDSFGKFVLNKLKDSGVTVDHIKMDEKIKTGISVILQSGGDRAIVTYLGTNDAVSAADFKEDILKNSRHLHIGSYYLMKSLQPYYKDIVVKAKENGMSISMDTNWDPDEKWDGGIWDVLKHVDIFLPNENEALAITCKNNIDQAMDALGEVVPVVVIKLGKEGATAYNRGQKYNASSINVNVVDAVGAGDSFDAGFVYGFLSGYDIEKCLRIACICGSLNTRAAGGTAAQPDLPELEKYINS